ncbi:hypothetical protein ACTWQB_16665 [Piscibacillus sp. B03]|uniref:hypothetical protein n=1 Tax=Piscibacillus sp. B03 TaxID=3457430 RepID=UPI003FCDF8BB
MTNVFIKESISVAGNNFGKDQVYDLEGSELQRVLETGQAIRFEVPEIDAYSQKVDNAVSKYKKGVQKIEQSKDPRYQDSTFKAEAINKLKDELKEEVNATQAEYADLLANVREESAKEVANKTVNISDFDRRQAEIKAKQLASEITLGRGEGALDQLAEDVKYLEEGRKQALALELPSVMQSVKGDEKLERKVKGIYEQTKQGDSPEALFARGVTALPNKCTHAYDRLTLIDRNFKDDNNLNVHREGNRYDRNHYAYLPQ